MSPDIQRKESESARSHDRFGEPIRQKAATAELEPERGPSPDRERARGRFRTIVSVIWLVLVLPLIAGALYTLSVVVRDARHTIATSRLRTLGALVTTRQGPADWPARKDLVVDLTREEWIVDFFRSQKITDADLASLAQFHHLVEVYIPANHTVTAEGLKALGNLPDLQAVRLGGYHTAGPASIEAEFAPLARLKHLTALDVSTMEDFSDGGLRVVGQISSLRELEIGQRGLYNDDVAHPHVTDRGLAEIANLKQLRVLRLSGTRVTDSGLANLEGLKKLEVLSLAGTDVTDAGLAHLKTLPALDEIDLKGTRVTLAGLDGLRAMFPSAVITSDLEDESNAAEQAFAGEARGVPVYSERPDKR